jgi:hypothetical protein
MQATDKLAPTSVQGRWLIEPMIELVGELQARSDWTWKHSGRVARYAIAFGKRVGFDRQTMMTLQSAAILHDVGKLAVAPELLNKATPLTRDEWYAITKHPMASSKMLRTQELPRAVVTVAQSHHEWYNGKGYPLGLEGEAIHPAARILSIADAFDAMNSDRPYRPALSADQIVAEIDKNAGTQFDPSFVRRLHPLLESGVEASIPHRRMRVISDDPLLYQQLWFAAYPFGWEIEAWPRDWAKQCPKELLVANTSVGSSKSDITIVDGRSVRRAPETVLARLQQPCLWIDPISAEEPAAFRPLSLNELLPFFDLGVATSDTPGTSRMKVLLADPYQLFRQALRRCLEERDDVEVVAEVDSPDAYREARARIEFNVAVVASDLVTGTHSTSLKGSGPRLDVKEATTGLLGLRPTVMLVADEDLSDDLAPKLWEPGTHASQRAYVHRGAPVEVLVEAMKELIASEPAG